jgi:hypothetical protein
MSILSFKTLHTMILHHDNSVTKENRRRGGSGESITVKLERDCWMTMGMWPRVGGRSASGDLDSKRWWRKGSRQCCVRVGAWQNRCTLM